MTLDSGNFGEPPEAVKPSVLPHPPARSDRLGWSRAWRRASLLSAYALLGASAVAGQEASPTPDPAPPTWADTALAALTLEQKVGQLMMPLVMGGFTPDGTEEFERIRRDIVEHEVGGVIVSVGSPVEVAAKLNRLQELSALPLLVASDLESGAGFRFSGIVRVPGTTLLGGATTFPSLMAIGATGDPELAYRAGRVTGTEAKAIGVHLPFSPVLDVNNNPENPIINIRSFGEDPAQVALLGGRFVEGLQESGVVATGKHFPGHGDTEVDSHLNLPVINADRERLDAIELVPFREAIARGMGAVMSAHIALPALTENGTPSTLSETVLSGLLRDEMGFDGIIVTDAMNMAAVNRRYGRGEAAVRALEAGADIILMPPDVGSAIRAIVRAVETGRVSEARLDESVLRLLALKETMGLDAQRTVDVADVPRHVGVPEHEEVASEVAVRSVTLLRNEGNLLPLRGTRNANVLSITYRRESDILAGRAFNRRLRQTYRRLRSVELHRDTDPSIYPGLRDRARSADLVVVSVYISSVSFGGERTVSEEFQQLVVNLRESGVPHIVISFANPYLLQEFPSVRAYMLTWGGTDASQEAAADALLGRVRIQGTTPTRIPPFFEIGDGLVVPRRTR